MIIVDLLLGFVLGFAQPDHPACELVYSRYSAHPGAEERLANCNEVAWAAEQGGYNVALVVELAWGESRFLSDAVNTRSGCSGLLQASPKWWCPNRKKAGCDLTLAGLRALRHYRSRHSDVTKALCHYKSGNVCTPQALKGAKATVRRANVLRNRLARHVRTQS